MKQSEERRLELTLCGRAGIDLNTEKTGCTFAEISSFSKSVGGSPANIVQGAARLGLKTAFLGKIARDGMGAYILEEFERRGIDTAGMVLDDTNARNCLALTEIISPDASGSYVAKGGDFHHGTYLYREGTADLLYGPDDVLEEIIANSQAVMVSGTAFSGQPSRDAMFKILRLAQHHKTTAVFDLDYRPYGWSSTTEASKCLEQAVRQCDIIIGNREEFNVLEYRSMPDNRDNRKSAEALLKAGTSLVIIKNGEKGSEAYTSDGQHLCCKAIPTNRVKTFGSGDAYAAGLMYGLLKNMGLEYAMQLGTACASIALTKVSCADSMPDFYTAEAHRKAHIQEMKV